MDADKLVRWFLGGDTGTSSKTIAGFLFTGSLPSYNSTPSDGGDFGRCIRLIRWMGWEGRVPELASINGRWAEIVDHWDALVAAYDSDGDVYSILRRIAPEGYRRDGFEVSVNDKGFLSSALKGSEATTHLGDGISITTRPAA